MIGYDYVIVINFGWYVMSYVSNKKNMKENIDLGFKEPTDIFLA